MIESELAFKLKSIGTDLPRPEKWGEEVERGDFQAILSKVDEELLSSPTSVEARLWWIRCQAELGQVPITALSSPLEDIYPSLKENQELKALSVATLLKLGERLTERKQLRLALVMLDRVVEVDSSQQVLLNPVLRDVIRLEINRAELRREPKAYVSGLQQRLTKLEETTASTKPASSANTNGVDKQRGLDSQAILSEAIDALEDDWHTGETGKSPAAVGGAVESQVSRTQGGLVVLGGAMVLAGCLFWVFTNRDTRDVVEAERLALNLSVKIEGEPMLPSVSSRVGGAATETLKRVTKRLEKFGSSKSESDQVTPPSTPEQNIGSESQSAINEPTPTQVLDKPDEKTPEMNPEKLAGANIQNLPEAPGRTAVDNIILGSDGRVYGPPDAGGRTLDGKPVRAVEVDQFRDPVFYRIIVPTKVFSAPSVIAESVAGLGRDAKVEVVAKLGHWLEIRSAKGRRGYIYAQDAARLVDGERR